MYKKLFGLWMMLGILTWTQGVWAQSSSTELRLRALEQKLAAKEEENKTQMRVFYNKGLKMETADKKFKLQIGGRIMTDFAFFNENDTFKASSVEGDQKSGGEFRRARIFLAGLLYNRIGFKAQYEFAGGSPKFKNVYIQLVKLPWVGNFRVGNYKEPWSLENLTSSKYITFMERSLPNAFSRSQILGMGFFNHALDQRLTWNVGIFYDTDQDSPISNFDIHPGEWNGGFRITGLPWYPNKGRQLVHLGFSYIHEDQGKNGSFTVESRPEAHLTSFNPVGVNLASGTMEKINRYNFEAAAVYGRFSLQFEYMLLNGDAPVGTPGVHYTGWYIHASYFITGEHRKYKTKSGTFARVSPRQNFEDGGWGAWQVALRYSTLDLNDDNSAAAYLGGEMDNITVGLNWHLNPNTRFMFNYVHSMVDSAAVPSASAGNLNIFQARFQIDF